ncbi:hypothetical protein ES703_57405 [subsurface metagenome]
MRFLSIIFISSSFGNIIFSVIWAMISSSRTTTGTRKRSAKLNALIVQSKVSRTVEGVTTIIGWSPWVPQRDCITSACEGSVGNPVLGPPLWTLTITHGTSAIDA